MKVGIIGGAGTIGSTVGFCLAGLNTLAEIVLTDVRENLLQAHVMDLEQAVSGISKTLVRSGGWDDLAGCDMVIVVASLPERQVKSRIEFLQENLDIIKSIAGQIVRYCPAAIVLNVTNPIDICNYVFYKLTGLPARQFIGYSQNDTLRFRWAIAQVMHVSTADVGAMVIGEHGDGQVPLYSKVRVHDKPVVLTDDQRGAVEGLIRNWFARYQALNSGRSSGWTSGIGITNIVEAVVKGSVQPVPCSAVLQGQYGIAGVSLGVPVILGPTGIEHIVELDLAAAELAALTDVAGKTAGILQTVPL